MIYVWSHTTYNTPIAGFVPLITGLSTSNALNNGALNMTSERITTKRIEDADGDPVVNVYVDGELHLEWPDYALTEFPEDLTWARMIADVFYSGVEAGKKLSV
jgi:hypothetical protein